MVLGRAVRPGADDFFASDTGLGFMTSVTRQTFYATRVMPGIVMLIVAGVVTEIQRRMERRFDRWRE